MRKPWGLFHLRQLTCNSFVASGGGKIVLANEKTAYWDITKLGQSLSHAFDLRLPNAYRCQ